jgi:transposase
MEWPSNSPNMNPIKYIWHMLKATLYKRYTDTSMLLRGPEKVHQQLEE